MRREGRKNLSPIFRDVTELTAHHSLSDKITEAVHSSRYLIVLCSPIAKASHWVNEEIRLFRKLHGEGAILCALIEGTPATSFPPALLEGGREPLAADLSANSFKLGVTQIAASMLGVGLDDLVQRDLKRLRRRVTAVTAGAIAALLVMGSLTWTAITSRDLAEQRRDDAEEMIEFMITDLKDELQSVGRLQPMTKVGERAAAYYDDYDLSDHDDDALGRRARVFHFLGEVQAKLGNIDISNEYYQRAFDATMAQIYLDPNNPDRIYEHIESVFGIARRYEIVGNYFQAKTYYERYLELAKRLNEIEGNSIRSQEEFAYAYTNMGVIEFKLKNISEAVDFFDIALRYKSDLFELEPQKKSRLISLTNTYNSLGDVSLYRGDLTSAISQWSVADEYLDGFLQIYPNDAYLLRKKVLHSRGLSRLHLGNNDVDLAKSYLLTGLDTVQKLGLVETDHFRVNYENALLNILNFEIEIAHGSVIRSKLISETISENISIFPSNSHESREYKLVNSLGLNTPIHIAIAESDLEHAVSLSYSRLKALKDEGVTSYEDIIASSYNLSAILLVNLILEDSYTDNLLVEYCNAEDVEFGYNHDILLSVKFTQNECPNMTFQAVPYPSVLKITAERLSKLNASQ